MFSKRTRIAAVAVFFTLVFSEIYANNSIPWITPTSDPVQSKIEEGWNFLILGGASFAHGKSRGNFLETGPWEHGLVSRTPWLELGFSYAPTSNWEFGLQVPLTVLSSTINAYYRVNDFVKFGLKVGGFSTLSTTFSIYPMTNWFISATPSVGFVRFGFPPSKTVNTTPFLSSNPPTYETLHQSRMTINGQLAFGRHLDPVDIALLLNYAYAPGNGIDNSYVLDDTLMKHFFRLAVGLVF